MNMRSKPRVLVTGLMLIAACVVSEIAIHECGHMLAIWICGGRINSVFFFGFQLYPDVVLTKWHGLMAQVPSDGIKSDWGHGFIALMGAGTSLVIAYLLLLPLGLYRKAINWFFIFLMLLALGCAWDSITYVLLPLMGLPHRLVTGSVYAEPLEGLALMGIERSYGVIAVLIHFLLYHVLLFLIVSRRLGITKASGEQSHAAA